MTNSTSIHALIDSISQEVQQANIDHAVRQFHQEGYTVEVWKDGSDTVELHSCATHNVSLCVAEACAQDDLDATVTVTCHGSMVAVYQQGKLVQVS